MKTITPYKTITITTDSAKKLLKKIEKKGISISSYAKDMALKIPTPKKKETVELGMCTVAELGFEKYPTTTELFDKIKSLGHELCPPMAGLHLRLEDYDQEVGWYYIAMKPITGSGGNPSVFGVERDGDGGRWLNAGWTDPDGRWSLGYRIVFRLRKSSELGTSEPENRPLDSLALCPHCKREIRLTIEK